MENATPYMAFIIHAVILATTVAMFAVTLSTRNPGKKENGSRRGDPEPC